jgi:precorrin-8X/cobalt-precorrin-8 methylmutase
MVAAGINALGISALGHRGCEVICKADEPLAARLARTVGISPAAAGVRLGFAESGPGALWVVGSAPGAIEEILSRFTHPALVIGVPVGLNGAAEAKKTLRDSGVPCLSNRSDKGGPAVAAAAFGALLRVAIAAGTPTRAAPRL